MKYDAATLNERVICHFAKMGTFGASDHQLREFLHAPLSAIRPIRRELHQEGFLVRPRGKLRHWGGENGRHKESVYILAALMDK